MSNYVCNRVWFALLILLLAMQGAQADEYKLFVGDMQLIEFQGVVERFTIGNQKILGGVPVKEGRALLLSAVKDGETELLVWMKGAQQPLSHKFYITKTDSERTSAEVAETLKNLLGIKLRVVGQNIVLEGRVNDQGAKLIEKVSGKYTDIIDLTTTTTEREVVEILRMVPNLNVRKVGKLIVVRGNVDADGKAALETIKGQFTEILDLTSEKLLVNDPMIFMNVKITEFGDKAIRNLGIDWTTSFVGPTVSYAQDFSNDKRSILDGSGIPQQDPSTYSILNSVGYFGIATAITSAINLAVTNGDALMLASPTLSAKSGGKAQFLAGGQIPISVPQGDGTMSTEFKDYGITLNIEPKAGQDGSITSKVMAEVSSIDNSVKNSQGTPGILSRKADTEVTMRDGQTLVISGLVSRSLDNTEKKVAGLGDIPLLGEFFKTTEFNNQKSDLVIFITPYIAGADSEINKAGLKRATELRDQFLQKIDKGPEILD